MPLYTTDALILRTYTLGESDRIVVFLTRDRGKKRGVAKNARKSFRRFGGGLEPMTSGRVAYVERERRELVLLNYVEPTRSPLSMLSKASKTSGTPGAEAGDALGYVSYFAELIDEWAQEADPHNETLFRLGSSMVEALVEGVPVERLARYFEYWLLRLQGVYEADPRASADALAFLDAARCSSPLGLADVPVSRKALRELESSHRELIAMHLEKELKSVRVLREMRR
jgi:DNA repair protein RecO (recombination protein O)